jgi:hypothetical protein
MKLSTLTLTALLLCSGAYAQDATPAPSAAATPKLSEEERFKKYDKDHDGFVSLEEATKSAKADPAKLEKATASFKKKDKDNDGKLSLEEWIGTKAAPAASPKAAE